MNKQGKISKSVFLNFINLFFITAYGIIVIPIIVKLIGKDNYGMLQMIASLSILKLLLELGFGATVVRYTPVYYKDKNKKINKFFWTTLFFRSIIILIGVIIFYFISINILQIFTQIPLDSISYIKTTVWIYAISFILVSFEAHFRSILNGFIRYDLNVYSQIISQLVFFLSLYLILKNKQNYTVPEIALIFYCIRPLLRIIMQLFFIRKEVPEINFIPTKPDFSIIRNVYRFYFGTSIITVLAQIYNRAPKFILSTMISPAAIAVYSIAERMKEPLKQINSSILRPLVPATSTINFANKIQIQGIICKASRYFSLFFSGISLLLFLYINNFILLWLGEDFIHASSLLRISIAPFLLPNSGVMLMMYYGQGRTKKNVKLITFNSLFGLTLGLILAKYYGVIGMIIGLSFSLTIVYLLSFIIYTNHFKVSKIKVLLDGFGRTYLVLLIVLISYLVLNNFITITSWLTFIIHGVIISIIYFLTAYIIFPRKEIQQLLKSLSKNV